MINFIENLKPKATLWKPIIFLAFFLAAFFIINSEFVGVAKLEKMTGGIGILDLENGYSVERAYEILSGLGEQGRAYYLRGIIPMDFIFPLSYMLFYASVFLYILKITPNTDRRLNLLLLVPVLAMLLDYSENFMVISMLNAFPEKLEGIAKASNFFTVLKFNMISVNAAIIVALLANFIIKKYMRNGQKAK